MIKKILIGVLFIGTLSVVTYADSNYTRIANVESVNQNECTFIDEFGHIWVFNGDLKGLKEGDKVVLNMHTNRTDNTIHDDYIKSIETE